MTPVNDGLRRLSHHCPGRELTDHTFQSTPLVHEAYLRLAGQNPPDWQTRTHPVGIAAFAGLMIEDTSQVPGISPAIVKRGWVTARVRLFDATVGEAPA
jgi:hypothetical protein